MKKLFLMLMVLGITAGFSQSTITLDLPDLVGYQNGETVTIPVMATDVIMPNEVSSFYIYVEWDDAVLDYVDAALSPEMAANIGPLSFIFQKGNASAGGIETTVGAWIDTFTGSTFSMNPGDVFFNITATYVGDGSDVLGVGATELNFQFSSKDEGGKLSKGVTEIIDASFTLFDLTYDVPSGGVNVPMAPTGITWEGDESVNWFVGGNWDGDMVPGAGDDVIIPASPVGPNMPTIWDFANVMGLENNGTITIDPDGGLFSAALIMNGGELVNNGSIVMLSVLAPPGGPGAPASTVLGQIVPDAAFGMSGTGTYEVDRLMNLTASAEPFKDGWHLLSSPVDGLTTDNIPNYYLNTWNEMATGVDPDFPWVHVEGDLQNPCTPVTPALPIGKMEGWSLKQDMEWDTYGCPGGVGDMISMMGSAWAMPYSTPVSLTGATGHAGYNLVGNPYFCGLDLLSVDWAVANANVNPMAYVYEEGNQAYQPLDGLVPDPFVGNTIAPTVGFFVMANADGGDFMLDGSEQVLAFGGAAKTTVENTLIIKATSSSHYDYMRIRFMDEATAGFDNMYDAYKFFSDANGLPQISTPAGEDMLAISSMEATQMVPMYFTSATSGNFTIEAIEASDFPEVYLQDLVTGTITDLLANDYEFNYTQGENQSRFIIHFAPVGIGELNAQNVKIWSRDNNIMVNVPADVTGEIAVYNMMGQEVARTDIEAFETQIQVSDVNTNYVVKVISDNSAVTGKVYVK